MCANIPDVSLQEPTPQLSAQILQRKILVRIFQLSAALGEHKEKPRNQSLPGFSLHVWLICSSKVTSPSGINRRGRISHKATVLEENSSEKLPEPVCWIVVLDLL